MLLVYKRIYDLLNQGGIFINREVVSGESSSLSDRYHQLWREYIMSNGEDDEKWFNKYLEEDIPAPVEVQTNWLREIALSMSAVIGDIIILQFSVGLSHNLGK